MSDPVSKDIFGLKGIASQTTDTEATAKWLHKHFKLPYNPFPPSGISPEAPEGPPLRDEQGQDISPIIARFIMGAYRSRIETQGLVVIGNYGTGKSHLLRLMHSQINSLLGSGDEKAISIYIQRPRIEAQDLNREILKSLGEDTVRKMIWFCIKDQLAADIKKRTTSLKELKERLEGPLFSQSWKKGSDNPFDVVFDVDNLLDYRTLLEAYDAQSWRREELRAYFRSLYTRSLETRSPLEVVDAFVTLLLAPDEQVRASWESLLSLGKGRKIPLLAAPEFLADLVSLIKANGYVYTFLLIDEFEEVPGGFLLTKRQQADYMYTLMEILNKIQENLGLVLAITPGAWNVLIAEAPPLRDRLPVTIRLGVLDSDSIIRLITYYLNEAREDAKIKTTHKLHPFSKETITELINQLSERTPRNVLQVAHQIIAYCITEEIGNITPEVIRNVVENFQSMKSVSPEKRRLN